MSPKQSPRIAILGDGPAGTTLATILARDGFPVALYSAGQRPELIVGESLVPAIIPILADLGVEEEIRSFSVLKPGATFVLSPEVSFHFEFGDVKGSLPPYAYNVPRGRFDRTLRDACEKTGAHIVEARGRVEIDPPTGRPLLTAATLAAADGFFDGQPDLIVDATGRSRLLANLMNLPTSQGDRKDTALFAHLDDVPLHDPGHVHSDRLEHGWAWRIPLGDRVSLGVVADPQVLQHYGNSAEAQYDGYLRSEPRLIELTANARRLTPVLKYNNYQLVTQMGVGPGWALAGDAFGFVDPVFSSGLYLAMDGAYHLADAIRGGRQSDYQRYERYTREHIANWQRIVGYFYDGRLFSLFLVGEQMASNLIGRIMNPHARRHLPRIFTGEATSKVYSRKLLDFLIEHSLLDNDPRELMVN